MSEPAFLRCPGCGQHVSHYCTLNDRVPLCEPCALATRERYRALTPGQLASGLALGALAGGAATLVCGMILAHAIDSKSSAFGWVYAIGSIALGPIIGRSARRGAGGVGGLPLQLAAAGLVLLAVIYVLAPVIVLGAPAGSEVYAAVLGTPYVAVHMLKIAPWRLLWMGWAVLDAWRATAPVPIELRGPFPVEAPPKAPGGLEGTGGPDARAAGMDFERPT